MQRVIVLSIVFCAALSHKTTHAIPNRLDLKTLKGFQDLFHDEAPTEYDVTYPYQSTPDGKFLSHDLRSSHRVKRNTERSDEHHYSLKAFDKTLHLNLRENNDLIAPGLVLESYADGKVKRTPLEPRTHYIGTVRDHPGSTVAISNHGALSGKIVLDGETLYIRPVPKDIMTSSDGRSPHLVYKPPQTSEPINVVIQDTVQRNEDWNIASRYDDNVGNSDGTKKQYYLEFAITAHEKVAEKYGDMTADFLLIISNLAAQAFQDPSIGENKIILVVTRLVIIPADQLNAPSLSIGSQLIGAFQRWVRQNNPVADSDPKHFDVGSFVSSASGGVGLASLNTVCGQVSANIIGDSGLQSWSVLAHEIAHNLGINHDVVYKCADGKNIMSTLGPGGSSSREWSTCSKERFTKLFNISRYRCLLDKPQAVQIPTITPSHQGKLPGVLFSKTRQCQMRYGPGSVACAGAERICANLYCGSVGSPSSCITHLVSVLDGTRCGVRNWCMKAKCVDDGSPRIHGGWSSWSDDYVPCTRSCGGGIKYKTRTCTNPVPKNGGEGCKGLSKGHIEICNNQNCPPGELSYRVSQCKKISSSYIGSYHRSRTCTLYCKPNYYTAVGKGTVKDGTRCDPNPRVLDVCIRGQCLAVGCDLKVGSNAKRDRCGVCNGDGTSCKFVNGSYTKDYRIKGASKADTIVDLTAGTFGITVKEREKTYNIIGVIDMLGKFLFKVPSRRRTVMAAGTKISVASSRGNATDHLHIPGPITVPLKIVYIYKKGANKGIDYEFYKPEDEIALSVTSSVIH